MSIDILNDRAVWITEWKEKVNNESDFPETGAGWGTEFNGDYIFEVEPDEELKRANEYTEDDVSDGVAFFAEVKDGEVLDSYPVNVDEIENEDYGFNYHGTYTSWKGLVKGKIGPIDGLMGGDFEVDGDMQKILQYSDGAASLANGAEMVDTIFPDEKAEA
jgi:putative sterol carrier protein